MNLRTSIFCTVLTLLTSVGQPLQNNPAEDLFTMAQLSLQQAQRAKKPERIKIEFQSAETWFTKFLQSYPRDAKAPEATYYLAVSQAQLGKPKESLLSYKKHLSYKRPGTMAGSASLQLGMHSYNAKEHEQAYPYFSLAVENLPLGKSKTLAHYTRALCAQKLENSDTYVPDLLYVLEQPDGRAYHDKCQFLLANEYLKAKQYDTAFHYFEGTTQSSDRQIKSQSILKCAVLAQKLGDTKSSLGYHRQALKLSELKAYHSTSALSLMNASAQEEDWKQVISFAKFGDQRLSEELQSKRNLMIGQAYLALGQNAQADPYLKKAITSPTGAAHAFDVQYTLLSKHKAENLPRQDAQNFLSTYKSSHQESPKYHSVKLLSAEHDFLAKKHFESLALYQSIRADLLAPENLPIIHYRVIQNLLKLGKTEKANPLIKQFITDYPSDQRTPYLLYDHATKMVEANQVTEAIPILQNLAQNTTSPATLRQSSDLLLAKLYLSQKEFAAAEAAYLKLFKTYKADTKENSSWLFWIGYSQYNQKKHVEANKSLLQSRQYDQSENAQELNRYLALCAYHLKDPTSLENELKRYEQNHKTLLPPALYLYLALDHHKQGRSPSAWWGFERALIPGNPESLSSHKPAVLEAYCKTALATEHYKEMLLVSSYLKQQQLSPYQEAQNYYHSSRAQYAIQGPENAKEDLDKGMRLNPSGILKYELLLLAGKIELSLNQTENGTRLLKQVSLLAPQEYIHLKQEALNVLINQAQKNLTPENVKLLEEYKKELEKVR